MKTTLKTVTGCSACRNPDAGLFPFTMAYQPIVTAPGEIFAYEALVRGPGGESAASVLSQVNEENMYAFDQACRVKAIETAARLQLTTRVSINFMPGAVYKPETCIRKTIETARRVDMPLEHIIFEVTENERVADRDHLIAIFREYRAHGLQTAIDDFGAGYAGLDLLADFQPDILKLDMKLVRDLDKQPPRRAIVRVVANLCRELKILLIAEGVETTEEYFALEDVGVSVFQGYLLGRPQLEALSQPSMPKRPLQPARGLAQVPAATSGTLHPGLHAARPAQPGTRQGDTL